MYVGMYAGMYVGRYLRTFLPSYPPTYLHTYIPTYLHTYIPSYLPTFLPSYLHTYIPTYLHTYIPTYLPTYIYIYIYIHMHVHILNTYHGIHTYLEGMYGKIAMGFATGTSEEHCPGTVPVIISPSLQSPTRLKPCFCVVCHWFTVGYNHGA